jgi:hypothetical protein
MELLLLLILIAVGGLPLLFFAGAVVLLAPVVGFLVCLVLGGMVALGESVPAIVSNCILVVFFIVAGGLLCVGYYDKWRDPIGYKKRVDEIYGRPHY